MNRKLAIVAGLFVAMCPSLPAQEIMAMHANIPFDFRMGGNLLPSGKYLISASGSVITLREEGGRMLSVSFLTIPESRVAPKAAGELVFNRYGNDYFLARVWTPDSKLGRSLPKTKQEKDVAKLAGGLVQTAAVRVK
jgi:hypothetical protein